MQRFVLVEERVAAPDVDVLKGDGGTVAISDFRGKVVLLNFWATWCPPCIREMPALDRLQSDLGGDDFAVVAVSTDAGGKAVAEPYLRDRLGLTNLDLYLDPKFTAWKTYQAGGLPTSFVIDRQGRLVGALVGEAEWDGDDAKALFRHLINEPVEISG
ncbi:MAG: TlpA disulfide reductase family protein [Alphaproteobacteria bacterium]